MRCLHHLLGNFSLQSIPNSNNRAGGDYPDHLLEHWIQLDSTFEVVSHLVSAAYPSEYARQSIIVLNPFIRISYLSMDWANFTLNDDQKKIPNDSCNSAT